MGYKNYLYIGIGIFLFIIAIYFGLHVDDSLEKNYCTQDQREVDICTEEWNPVCGHKGEELFETYSNSCFACRNPEVIYWTKGEC